MKSIDDAIDLANEMLGLQCKDCGMLTGLEEKCGWCDSLNVGQSDVCDLFYALKGKPKHHEKMLESIIERWADERQDNLWLLKKQAQLMRQIDAK